MTFEQIDKLLNENKSLQRKLIKSMAKSSKNQLATILELKSLSFHQEELEQKYKEEVEVLRFNIRKQISEKGHELYTSLPAPLKYLAGEIMVGNENIIVSQIIAGKEKTIGAESILKTGFTTNQTEFLLEQKSQLDAIKTTVGAMKGDSEKSLNLIKTAIENSEKLEAEFKEINMVLGAIDGNTLKHARKLVVMAKDRAGQISKLKIENEMYADHVRDFCATCSKHNCKDTCPLYVFYGWSKIG